MGAQHAGNAHPTLGEFLEDHREGGVVETQAAVLLRHGDAEQPQFRHLLDEPVGVGVVPVVGGGLGRNLPPDELPHEGQYLVCWSLWALLHPAHSPTWRVLPTTQIGPPTISQGPLNS